MSNGDHGQANRLPDTLTLEQAFRAAFFMIENYGDVEKWKSDDLDLLHVYMQTDPARWEDWEDAVAKALENPSAAVLFRGDAGNRAE